MVPSRHPLPIPAWAELSTDPAAIDSFRPFVTGGFSKRAATSARGVPLGAFPEAPPALRDDDGDAPKASHC